MTMRVQSALASLTLLAAVLAACAQDGDAAGEPEPSQSPTSSNTPDSPDPLDDDDASPVEHDRPVPQLPDAARANTPNGAEEFVRYYIDLLNYGAATGQVGELNEAARDCGGCQNYEKLYRKVYERGGYIRSSHWRPTYILAAVQGDGSMGVLVDVRASRSRYSRSEADSEHIGRGGSYKLRFELMRADGTWVVTYFGRQSEIKDR